MLVYQGEVYAICLCCRSLRSVRRDVRDHQFLNTASRTVFVNQIEFSWLFIRWYVMFPSELPKTLEHSTFLLQLVTYFRCRFRETRAKAAWARSQQNTSGESDDVSATYMNGMVISGPDSYAVIELLSIVFEFGTL